MKNKKGIHILLIEDDTDDALLFMEMVSDEKTDSIGIEHVTSLTAGVERIREGGIDIVLSDLGLPESRGLDTLDLLLPVIVLTDLADQEIGAEALRAGAQDYLFKGEVTGSLLVRSILYAIERKKMMVEREKLRQELEDALDRVKLLSGFLPICFSCKKIRDDKGYWHQIELYKWAFSASSCLLWSPWAQQTISTDRVLPSEKLFVQGEDDKRRPVHRK